MYWLVDWLIDWFIDWLIDALFDYVNSKQVLREKISLEANNGHMKMKLSLPLKKSLAFTFTARQRDLSVGTYLFGDQNHNVNKYTYVII